MPNLLANRLSGKPLLRTIFSTICPLCSICDEVFDVGGVACMKNSSDSSCKDDVEIVKTQKIKTWAFDPSYDLMIKAMCERFVLATKLKA